MRLIRDGYRVGMLSSIRVIHSHTRTVQYYLRRSFVDVVLLTDIFPDFLPPASNGLAGSLAAAAMLSKLTPDLTGAPLRSPLDALDTFVDLVRQAKLPEVVDERWDGFGFKPLQAWLDSHYAQHGPIPGKAALIRASFEQTRNMFADRLTSLETALSAYPVLDETVRRELTDAIVKTLAMTIGSQLAFCCVAPPREASVDGLDEPLGALRTILMAGV